MHLLGNMSSSSGVQAIADIEDIVASGESGARAYTRPENKVLPRALRRKKRPREDLSQCDSFIPGSHLVYIKTWGCSHNTSDGEYMAGLLAASGYCIVGM